jgi:hypothetical protein
MKIVVLRNRLPNEDHAVVAVRVDNQWLILDNRTLTLVRDMDVRRAIPEFVLDDERVSRFVWSSRNWKVSGPLPVTDKAARHLRFGLIGLDNFFGLRFPRELSEGRLGR